MSRIVIGYDGSPGALDALAFAHSLSKLDESELVVAAVLTSVPPPTTGGDERALVERFDRLFADVQRELLETSFTRCELHERSASDALSALAEREQVDLMVIGSTHRGPVGRVLLGSVGERLLQGAPCPVAVAPRGYSQRELHPPRTIGVAFDGGAESRAAVEAAAELAERASANLIVLSVAEPVRPGYGEALSVLSADELFEFKRKATEEALEAALTEVSETVAASGRVLVGDPAEELAKATAELDLLVVGSRGYGLVRRTLLGSTSIRLIRKSSCPVLVISRRAGTRATPATDSGNELNPHAVTG